MGQDAVLPRGAKFECAPFFSESWLYASLNFQPTTGRYRINAGMGVMGESSVD